MTSGSNRRPGWQSRNGGTENGSSSTPNVVASLTKRNHADDFDLLTAIVIRDRRLRGEIDSVTAATYLAAIGVYE